MLRRASTAGRNPAWLAVLPITFVGLGTWQLYRLEGKLKKIQTIEEGLSAPPRDITTSRPEDLEGLNYIRVAVTGTFQHDKEVLVEPKTNTVYAQAKVGQRAGEVGEAGAQVVTPLLRPNGQAVLVNRGFVRKAQFDPAARADTQTAGTVTVTGLLRRGEAANMFTPENQPERRRWYWIDLPSMARSLGALPILVDADGSGNVPGGIVGGQTVVALPNNHLQYALTWYSLGAITGALVYTQMRKRRLPRVR